MEQPRVADFLQSIPLPQRLGWERFVQSLNSQQLQLLNELVAEIAIKPSKGVDSDGLGSNLADRVVDIKTVKRVSIKIEGDDRPFPAIIYRNHTYSLFRTLTDWSAVEKIASRLRSGYVVTPTPKGWVIWVHEQDEV